MDSPALPQSRVVRGGAASPGVRRQAAFDLKGTMAPLTVLRLHTLDLMQIERQLRTKIAQRPQLFLHAPVLLDLGALDEPGSLALAALVSLMKGFKLVPVGATNVPAEMTSAIAAAGLGILAPPTTPAKARGSDADEEPSSERAPEPLAAAAPAPAPAATAPEPPPLFSRATDASAPAVPGPVPPLPAVAAHGGPMVVTRPVRSGQVIYAQNNDLVVLAPVNPGAQVMADGHVHIYSTLRGRAVAGAQGLPGARIFCQKLEAELVAIADAYVMAEEIPAKLRGRAVQVYRDGAECRIAAL